MSLLFLTQTQTGTRQYDSLFLIFAQMYQQQRNVCVLCCIYYFIFLSFLPYNALKHFSTKTEMAEILLRLHRQMLVNSWETLRLLGSSLAAR